MSPRCVFRWHQIPAQNAEARLLTQSIRHVVVKALHWIGWRVSSVLGFTKDGIGTVWTDQVAFQGSRWIHLHPSSIPISYGRDSFFITRENFVVRMRQKKSVGRCQTGLDGRHREHGMSMVLACLVTQRPLVYPLAALWACWGNVFYKPRVSSQDIRSIRTKRRGLPSVQACWDQHTDLGFPTASSSSYWFLMSTYVIWILGSKLALPNNPSNATLWVPDTCLIIWLRPLMILLITASLSSKMYSWALPGEKCAFVVTWSRFDNSSTFRSPSSFNLM